MAGRDAAASASQPKAGPGSRDADAWRNFLLSRVAAYEEDFRFLSSSILVALGIFVSSQFALLVSGGGEPPPLFTIASWLVAGAGVVLFLMFRYGMSGFVRRRNLALNLAQDLLEGADVDRVSREWRREFPRPKVRRPPA